MIKKILIVFLALVVIGCGESNELQFQKTIVPYFKSNVVPPEDLQYIIFDKYEHLDEEKIAFIDGTSGYLVSSFFEVTSSKDGKFYAAVVTIIRGDVGNLSATGAVFSWISEENFTQKNFNEKLKERQQESKSNLISNGHLMSE